MNVHDYPMYRRALVADGNAAVPASVPALCAEVVFLVQDVVLETVAFPRSDGPPHDVDLPGHPVVALVCAAAGRELGVPTSEKDAIDRVQGRAASMILLQQKTQVSAYTS